MKSFETKLDADTFLRVHRSALVNLDRVEKIEPFSHGEYLLTLRDGTKVRSSKAYSTRLHELLRSS
jgi:two-component system LytT family response regulator